MVLETELGREEFKENDTSKRIHLGKECRDQGKVLFTESLKIKIIEVTLCQSCLCVHIKNPTKPVINTLHKEKPLSS